MEDPHQNVFLKGEEAVRLYNEIERWEALVGSYNYPSVSYRMEIVRAHNEALQRYRDSLPRKAKRRLKWMGKVDKYRAQLFNKFCQSRTKRKIRLSCISTLHV